MMDTHAMSLSTTQPHTDIIGLVEDHEPGEVLEQYPEVVDRTLRKVVHGDVDVTWLQGQSCTGCTISMVQEEYDGVAETLSAFRDEISFHPTLMTESGQDALTKLQPEPDILVVEGSIPTEVPRAATLGHDTNGNRRPLLDWVLKLAEEAAYVVAVGSCAAFGGLPAARSGADHAIDGHGPTGARGLQHTGKNGGEKGVLGPDYRSGAGLPVINIPGCPAHPDHTLLTIATLLNGHEPDLDDLNRPLPFFQPNVHATCPLFGDFADGKMAEEFGEDGCLAEVGCAGFYAFCDDSKRLRNGGTQICRTAGAPCIGCVEPDFWDRFSPFYEKGDDGDVWGEDE
jgi:hydrogenase small subunit